MPARRRKIGWPAWVQDIDDPCLQAAVQEALIARESAVRHGAPHHQQCQAAMESADVTLDQIEFGRVHGKIACTKAATALRKYTVAAECGQPTARRR